MLSLLKKQGYTGWLLFVVVLALILPGPGAEGGILHSEITSKIGIWLIFLVQGLSLRTNELVRGYRPIRFHAFCLGWNFLLFPILVWVVLQAGSFLIADSFVTGFWMLAILPTTISSAVAFSSVAGGNVPHAIFATVASNLLAILLVPAIALAYLAIEAGASLPVAPLVRTLGLLILFPLLLGQLLRKFAPERAAAAGKRLKPLPNAIILFLVHVAFANSVASGFFSAVPLSQVVAVFLVTVVLLASASGLVWISSGWLHASTASRISALFCASQKSLATGFPLVTSILAVAPVPVSEAAILLPLLCYHPSQIALAGVLVPRLQKAVTRSAPAP